MFTGKNKFNFSEVSIFGKRQGKKHNHRRNREASAHQMNSKRKINLRFLTSKLFVQKLVSILLIMSILAQVTPAMQTSFLTTARELQMDLAFSLSSSSMLAFLS